MENNDKFWLMFTGIMMLGAVVIVGLSQLHHTMRCKLFIENGFTRDTVKGCGMVQWVKDEK